MSVSLHVRDLPDSVHHTLRHRAAMRGMSLRQYVTEVLTRHCALPTMEDWLDELEDLVPSQGEISGADAVNQARTEDDRELMDVHRRR
ncbi:MAG: FitA-like ribbon-helix-helix domain-containing protein [Egibacteraceae bacterium]